MLDQAQDNAEKNLDAFSGPEFDIREYDTSWNNFDVTVNDQNVGSFIISQYDKFFTNFNTSFNGDGSPLIDSEELRMLSGIVQKKILELDNVSPPPNSLDNTEAQKIPEWVRNIFVWYAEEKVSEDELLNAIKYLIQQDIIKLD